MSIDLKVITSFQTLMILAKKLGNAKKEGDPVKIAAAEAEHAAYRDMCLNSDEMLTGGTWLDLS